VDDEEQHGAGANAALRDGLRDSAGEVHEVQRLVLDPQHLLLNLIHILLTSLASCFGTRAPPAAAIEVASGWMKEVVAMEVVVELAAAVVAWAENRRRRKKRVLESFH
jgi:hypothetical protein